MHRNPGHVLVANPGTDVYGSDLQMLESVRGLVSRGWTVTVAAPSDGPLTQRLRDAGADVRFLSFPVLRRSTMSVGPLLALAWELLAAVPRLVRAGRALEADVVYVNTVTIPWWVVAGRLAGRRTVCHVHEAENSDGRLVRTLLSLPLLLADALIVISTSAREALCEVLPTLHRRMNLVPNGVPGPRAALPAVERPGRRLAVVGRLSPRKAPHVALEAVSLLRAAGREPLRHLARVAGGGSSQGDET